jgi:hypothetical protein
MQAFAAEIPLKLMQAAARATHTLHLEDVL